MTRSGTGLGMVLMSICELHPFVEESLHASLENRTQPLQVLGARLIDHQDQDQAHGLGRPGLKLVVRPPIEESKTTDDKKEKALA